ncbi:MAG: hypothetical protein IJO33_01895 [Bacilli bacterium]|nr:hypothetical protein [Bacilli bacterium]
MEKNIVINNLKDVLESSTMTTYLNSVSSETEKFKWLQKALYFMISTGNYEEVYMYLLKGYDITFPKEYLSNKIKTEKEIQELFKNNYLGKGFWYHGTSKYASENILDKGLCSLEQRYGKEFITDVVIVNQLCKDIANSTEKYSLGKVKLDEKLPLDFLKGSFSRVWLSAEISQAFHYANNNNAWLRTFIKNLLIFFKVQFNYIDYNNKENLYEQITNSLIKSKAIISKVEIETILNFIDKYYNDLEMSKSLKDIALVFINPNANLNNIVTYHDDKNRGITHILGQISTQELSSTYIAQEDLAVLNFNENGSLSLKLGKRG